MFGPDYDKLWIPTLTALAVAAVNYWTIIRNAQTTRHATRLLDQLRWLYGPLYFYTGRNVELMEQYRKWEVRHKDAFENKEPPQGSPEQNDRDSVAILSILNNHSKRLRTNNVRMMRIVTKYYAFIDPKDTQRVQAFLTECNRLELETDVPRRFLMGEGLITIFRADFADHIAGRFKQLTDEWHNLTVPFWKRWSLCVGERVKQLRAWLVARNKRT